MQKQRIILFVTSLILALIAAFMAKRYLDQQRKIEHEKAKNALAMIQENQVVVLVAKQDIPPGTVIDAEMLGTAILPKQFAQPMAATSLDKIAGMTTIAPIVRNEQITLTKLTTGKTRAGRGGSLAEVTPPGKRAITIPVDNISSLAGMIKSGDYVDVIAMVPLPEPTMEGKEKSETAVIPLFQNVLVLAVGQEIGGALPVRSQPGQEEKKETAPLITLALIPQEANFMTFIQEQQNSKVRLVLRSPQDSQLEPVQPANWDTLFQYLMPRAAPKVAKPTSEETAEPTEYVEIYRGIKKEKIPLYNFYK